MQFGIQLYTVRDHTDDDSFKDTLKRLADMGFQGVEFAWKYGGMEPEELADFLSSLGLTCCGLHLQLDELLDPDHKVYEYALACASPYVTTSLAGQTAEFEQLAPKVDEAARVAAAKGLQFTYHNHHQEFTDSVGGLLAQNYLTMHTDPALVGLEIDLGWIMKAGVDPLTYWQVQAERTPQIHLRDYSVEEGQITDIGAGFIDLAAVAEQGREFGLDWLIYEQDRYPVSAFDSCRLCADRARAAGII